MQTVNLYTASFGECTFCNGRWATVLTHPPRSLTSEPTRNRLLPFFYFENIPNPYFPWLQSCLSSLCLLYSLFYRLCEKIAALCSSRHVTGEPWGPVVCESAAPVRSLWSAQFWTTGAPSSGALEWICSEQLFTVPRTDKATLFEFTPQKVRNIIWD
jgi:hypothetical protein